MTKAQKSKLAKELVELKEKSAGSTKVARAIGLTIRRLNRVLDYTVRRRCSYLDKIDMLREKLGRKPRFDDGK
jgi:hypothetical protein